MLVGGRTNETVRPECYDVLARYMASYVEAYASHGVHIDFFECFNEPTDSYTQMDPAQLATFLGRHAGPTFEKRGLWPKMKLTYGGQCARETAAAFVPEVLADEAAAKYMDLIAYHGAHHHPARASPPRVPTRAPPACVSHVERRVHRRSRHRHRWQATTASSRTTARATTSASTTT